MRCIYTDGKSTPLTCAVAGGFFCTGVDGLLSVNYDGFIDDVSRGDELLIEGGIMSCVVLNKTDTDVEVCLGLMVICYVLSMT